MKYAICLRGISYLRENIRIGMEPYEINFEWSYPFLKKNIIDPLKDQGHKLDIFFNTYKSEKLENFIKLCNPVDSLITEYNPNIGAGDWNNINKINYDTLNLIKNYQDKNNIKYDMVILTRFDLVPFAKITDFYIPNNTLSIIEPRMDVFFIFSNNILDIMIKLFHKNFMIHNFVKILNKKYKINTHIMFNKLFDSNCSQRPLHINPLGTNARNVFLNSDHFFRKTDILAIKEFDNMEKPESWYPLLEKIYSKYWKPNIFFTLSKE